MAEVEGRDREEWMDESNEEVDTGGGATLNMIQIERDRDRIDTWMKT